MWNDDWREELKTDDPAAYERLCDCRNRKTDVKKIAKLIYKYNMSHTKEECLDRAIEWLTDWNNQPHLVPDTDEYEKILDYM